jgi:hypothetical protein
MGKKFQLLLEWAKVGQALWEIGQPAIAAVLATIRAKGVSTADLQAAILEAEEHERIAHDEAQAPE